MISKQIEVFIECGCCHEGLYFYYDIEDAEKLEDNSIIIEDLKQRGWIIISDRCFCSKECKDKLF